MCSTAISPRQDRISGGSPPFDDDAIVETRSQHTYSLGTVTVGDRKELTTKRFVASRGQLFVASDISSDIAPPAGRKQARTGETSRKPTKARNRDSFRGFPPTAADRDEGRWQPGRCHSPIEFTTAVLEAEGVDLSRVTLVPGWFADTLNDRTAQRHQITKASVIMIDCDLYSSTKEALNFCAPFIEDEALVLFDEWNVTRLPDKTIGEKKAFREFLHQHKELSVVPFGQYAPRSQAFLVRRKGLMR